MLMQPRDTTKFKAATRSEFHEHIKNQQSYRNCGCHTKHMHAEDETHWFIGSELVGVSDGYLGSNGPYFIAL